MRPWPARGSQVASKSPRRKCQSEPLRVTRASSSEARPWSRWISKWQAGVATCVVLVSEAGVSVFEDFAEFRIAGLEKNWDAADFDGDGCAARCGWPQGSNSRDAPRASRAIRRTPGAGRWEWRAESARSGRRRRVRSRCAASKSLREACRNCAPPSAASLVPGLEARRDSTDLPRRRIEVTRPRTWLSSTDGSSSGERVAARGEDDAIALGPFAHHAMHEEAATEQQENDFAATGVGDGFGAHGEEIARDRSRESCCCRGRRSELRRNGAGFRRQDRGALLRRWSELVDRRSVWCAWRHEFFRLKRHGR